MLFFVNYFDLLSVQYYGVLTFLQTVKLGVS